MKRVFGDSLYFLALANPRDQFHRRAVEFAHDWKGVIITSRWVLAEICDGLSSKANRALALHFMEQITTSARFRVVMKSDGLFERGLALYRSRADKDWSLTDCISFTVMADENLTEALTGDRHFEQAGFHALLV